MKNMILNVGKQERGVRIVLGVAFLAMPEFVGVPFWATAIAYILGLIALVTGITGFCPAWKLFGRNICKTKPLEHKST